LIRPWGHRAYRASRRVRADVKSADDHDPIVVASCRRSVIRVNSTTGSMWLVSREDARDEVQDPGCQRA